MHVILYTQSGCSKSERAKDLLREEGYSYEEVDMSTNPPTPERLIALARKLHAPLVDLLRPATGYPGAHDVESDATEMAVASWMVAHPESIQRPIVETNQAAILARPPEQLVTFLKEQKV